VNPFSNFFLLIRFLMTLRDFFLFMENSISDAEYMKRVRAMKNATARASSGDLEDRLRGGRDVEDQINDRT